MFEKLDRVMVSLEVIYSNNFLKIKPIINNKNSPGHAYTITKLAVITSHGRNVRLIRIRNPWGNEVEWKGAWADGSREWNSVSDDEIEEIGLNFNKDGEFWLVKIEKFFLINILNYFF
jgi:hypothetical protein